MDKIKDIRDGDKDPTHVVDRQFGAPLRIWLDECGLVERVEDWEYKGAMSKRLMGKTIEEVHAFFAVTFIGTYHAVKPWESL